LGITERKDRARAEREDRIVAAARAIAGREGWSAVTIRRLAGEIEYSQPVLYSHFENRDAIVAAVALRGFRDLTAALREAAGPAGDRLTRVATAYLDFARAQPAVYEAMFTMPTSLRFAAADTPPELREAFAALATVAAPSRADGELVTETLWAALHGLAELERSGRIRPGARAERLALVVRGLVQG
jgi:AcrR family transcriptional regulator